jgi:hypothetical protein
MLGEIGLGGVYWIDLAQDRNQLRALMNAGNEISGSIECWETIEWLHNLWPVKWC